VYKVYCRTSTSSGAFEQTSRPVQRPKADLLEVFRPLVNGQLGTLERETSNNLAVEWGMTDLFGVSQQPESWGTRTPAVVEAAEKVWAR